jgi:5-methyltetrahydrofolate--homocysteine methyltransferase
MLHGIWPVAAYGSGELEEWVRFTFPRQSSGRHLCIADYFAPVRSGAMDVCAFQIATMGAAAADHSTALYNADRYQEYLYFHGFSVACAEALAEYWHKSVRTGFGIVGKDDPDIKQLFAHGYQGARYSFGYPACPNLDDQVKLIELLHPERIGVTLTETCQLVPEQSTSALITHHHEAAWFGV